MKILHVITSLNEGGAEAVLVSLCSKSKSDFEHVVVSMTSGGKYKALLLNENILVEELGMNPGSLDFSALIKLTRLIRYHKPDIVQTWMYHSNLIGSIAARLAGVRKVLWSIHNNALVRGVDKSSTILVSKLCSWLSFFVPKRIIYCARSSSKTHEKLSYNSKVSHLIHNGYDIEKFFPNSSLRSQFRESVGCQPRNLLIGFVGRFSPAKDHENLFSALEQNKREGMKFKCCLAGQGISRNNNELTSLIDKHNLSNEIILLGSRSDVERVMNGLDIHVLPSVTEAFPNVLCEAMACGTPCISTDVGDARLIISRTGWIVPKSDSKSLADALSQASLEAESPGEWEQRRQNCRERIVRNYSIDSMVLAYTNVWQTTAN